MRTTTRIIGPGKNDFIQSLIQKRHVQTPEGKLMSGKQRSEISKAKHPPSHFIYQSNIRNLDSSRHISV